MGKIFAFRPPKRAMLRRALAAPLPVVPPVAVVPPVPDKAAKREAMLARAAFRQMKKRETSQTKAPLRLSPDDIGSIKVGVAISRLFQKHRLDWRPG